MVKWFKPSTRNMLASLWAGLRDTPEPDAADVTDNTHGVEIVHRLRSLKHDKQAWLAELDRLEDEGYQPEIVFIDTGLVTRLNETNRRNFLDLFTAVASFDGYRAGQLMVERCRAPELVIDEETFALKMQKLVLGVKSQTFSLAKIKIADVLSQVLTNVREHHVKMEADFVNTVISIPFARRDRAPTRPRDGPVQERVADLATARKTGRHGSACPGWQQDGRQESGQHGQGALQLRHLFPCL